jgi:hypothetical protein
MHDTSEEVKERTMETPIEAYPLTWPAGRPRTPVSRRRGGQFQVPFTQAREELLYSLSLLGASRVIISSNVPLRQDGLPRADSREPSDSGVAVYFQRDKKPFVIACDTYNQVRQNLRAIGATVEALRSIQRHGASSMLEQAFTGFSALPPARTGEPSWWEVLGVPATATLDEIRAARDALALRNHPDMGGEHDVMAAVNRAFDRACEDLSASG